jgi:RNA polymerase sigma-70 factor (ECF subfamily)
VDKFGSSLERLANAYEADPEKCRDLSQDIHFQLRRSFQRYDARCSLRTWTIASLTMSPLPMSSVKGGPF